MHLPAVQYAVHIRPLCVRACPACRHVHIKTSEHSSAASNEHNMYNVYTPVKKI
jgi:hypothetical protein